MPFNFKDYDKKCSGLSVDELQREWQHYTRLITGAATSTSISGLALPFTLGVSGVGVAMSAPAIHNARKKRAIIEKSLIQHKEKHVTRKRDVLGSMTVSGAIGMVTLGASSFGADAIAVEGAQHGISSIVENGTVVKVATHAAMDGAGMAVEHIHKDHIKQKEAAKAFEASGVFQAAEDAKATEISGQPTYNPRCLAASSSSASLYIPPPPPYNPAGDDHHIQPQSGDRTKKLPAFFAQDNGEDYLPPPYPPFPPRPSSSTSEASFFHHYQGNRAEQWYVAAQPCHPGQGMHQLPSNVYPPILCPASSLIFLRLGHRTTLS